MDERFKKLTEWLLFGLIDFDFISEALWKSQTPDDALLSDEAFSVGKMKYETILVPNCLTLRSSTLERLKVFQKKGGRVVFLGELPRFIDAIPSDEAEVFSESCEKIHFAKENVLNVLQKERLLDVHDQSGMRTANLIYQLREEKDREWLFFAHCNAMPNPDLPKREDLVIEINGIYEPVRYDAMTGECCESVYFHKEGKTVIRQTVYDHDSLLYSLKPAAEEKMAFGDVRSQGLPFYGGNLTYKTSIDIREKCDLKIEITRFKSPLLKVFLDGKDCGAIAFSPYALEIRDITPGKHRLEIEFFGNRYNTFGALHNCNETLSWKGHPNSYRTVGEAWSYEYQIHPQGILKAPVIKIIKG